MWVARKDGKVILTAPTAWALVRGLHGLGRKAFGSVSRWEK